MKYYENLYTKLYNRQKDGDYEETYGHTNHGKPFLSFFLSLNKNTKILDVGCGHNEFINELNKKGFRNVVGMDFACDSADVKGSVTRIPFMDKQFDYITAWDVLEHLPETEVPAALTEMKRVSKKWAFSISFVPSRNTLDGHPLHETIWPSEKWRRVLLEYSCHLQKKTNNVFFGTWK